MYALYTVTYIYVVALTNPYGGSYMSTETEAADMTDTSIRVTHDLADELHDRKDRGDSYEDVIWELIEEADGESAAADPREEATDG